MIQKQRDLQALPLLNHKQIAISLFKHEYCNLLYCCDKDKNFISHFSMLPDKYMRRSTLPTDPTNAYFCLMFSKPQAFSAYCDL